MAEAKIVEASEDHFQAILEDIRPDDVKEFSLLLLSPQTTLKLSLQGSVKAWTGMLDDVPVCLFGLHRGEFVLGHMRPWLVGTKTMEKNAVTFLRHCKPVVEEMLAISPHLVNYVWEGNRKSIRWLRWLGFSIGEKTSLGRGKFHRFEMRRTA